MADARGFTRLDPNPQPTSGFGVFGPVARRVASAAAYALLAVYLAKTVADDLAPARETLVGVAGILPGPMAELGPDPVTMALVSIGLTAFALAIGTHLVGQRSGSAFALLVVGTVGWFLFPYAQVPWAQVFSEIRQETVTPPGRAWVVAATMVAIATAEVVLSARENVLGQLREQRVGPANLTVALEATTIGVARLVTVTVLVGGAAILLYAAYQDELLAGIISNPDLILVPALMGLAAGVAVYLAARRG